ncbi:MAG: glycosyltransferase, partial [Chitinophagia bacterium]|nr:glycosyltransferase [Chitinophagia bacterium]
IESVLAQKYPADLLEIIVVDDHSEDGTSAIVAEYKDERIRCIQLADHLEPGKKIVAYKKASIAAGIAISKGDLIVTTDADCTAPNLWLLNVACCYEQGNQPAMIVAPVIFTGTTGLLRIFQLIDFMGMQGVTAATHALELGFMSNGANLAFSKAVFNEVGGYAGVDHLATGDDYLLMMKIARHPGAKIAYLKSQQAIVSTVPQPDWYSFLQQRIRWSSKSGKYDDRKLTSALLLVYTFNLMLVLLGIGGFFNNTFWFTGLTALLAKIGIEYLFMVPVTAFFGRTWTRGYFPFLQPVHIIYITIAGFFGFIGKYTWKDRSLGQGTHK